MKILVINAGSSSLKYQLIDMETEKAIAKGGCERIGIDGSFLKHKANGKEVVIERAMPDHKAAISLMLETLVDKEYGAIKSMNEIDAVGHRILHSGGDYDRSVLITDEVLKVCERNAELAPLHQYANITGVNACRAIMPGVPMVATFDTAFHSTMPEKAYIFGLPYEYYTDYKVRRYGAHGTSHRFVSGEALKYLGADVNNFKVITCHLGNGSSIAAVKNGKCYDTSMSFTPLGGVPMGTRTGDLDPAVVGTIAERENMTASEVVTMLNKSSGFIGLSGGLSNDWRDINNAAKAGDERGQRTAEVWSYRIRKYIGAYAAAMNGLDVVVFTAGIGENSADARKYVMTDCDWLGIKLDDARNNANETVISTDDSKVKVLVVPTNEELAIARDTLEIVSAL